MRSSLIHGKELRSHSILSTSSRNFFLVFVDLLYFPYVGVEADEAQSMVPGGRCGNCRGNRQSCALQIAESRTRFIMWSTDDQEEMECQPNSSKFKRKIFPFS